MWILRAAPTERRTCRSAADIAHHVLDPGVVLEAIDRKVLAIARVLEAAMGHLRHERYVRVDPDRAEVQQPSGPHRASVIPGPDARRQAVPDAIGPPDRLVF